MDKAIYEMLVDVNKNKSKYTNGFSIREEGIYMLADAHTIGCLFDKSIVKLTNSSEEQNIGRFEINTINGESGLSYTDYEKMQGVDINDISITFNYIEDNDSPKQIEYTNLADIKELIRLEYSA